jgi:UDP-N-acetylmuramoylalanine--D-glutamate ligase
VGGNIGMPLIERVGELTAQHWAVLELSELQLPTISRGAEIAVYTNVGADHLDRHGSVEAYRAVKARLAELSVAAGRVVLNADDPGSRELGARLPAAALSWYGAADEGRGLAASVEDGWLVVRSERVMPAGDVPLRGSHLLADALAAALAGSLAGVGPAAVARGIRDFPGVPHRMEAIGELGGVRFVNDSQATIPVAAAAALAAFAGEGVVLIAGGKDKGLDYGELADAIATGARAAVLIGETADELERLIAGRVPVERAGSMDEAVQAAAGRAEVGDVVLLSPAAASFDMFADYAARGDAFRAAVQSLPEGGS